MSYLTLLQIDMPTYFAAGVSIRLDTHEIPAAYAPDIGNSHGREARSRLAAAEADKRDGVCMAERPVDCLNEQGAGALKFLGRNLEIPFYCISVNNYDPPPYAPTSSIPALEEAQERERSPSSELSPAPSSASSTSGHLLPRTKGLRASTKAQAFLQPPRKKRSESPVKAQTVTPAIDHQESIASIPQTIEPPMLSSTRAISLNIKLDPIRSFCRTRKRSLRDIKVDVYVNGTLSTSTLIWAPPKQCDSVGMEYALSGERQL